LLVEPLAMGGVELGMGLRLKLWRHAGRDRLFLRENVIGGYRERAFDWTTVPPETPRELAGVFALQWDRRLAWALAVAFVIAGAVAICAVERDSPLPVAPGPSGYRWYAVPEMTPAPHAAPRRPASTITCRLLFGGPDRAWVASLSAGIRETASWIRDCWRDRDPGFEGQVVAEFEVAGRRLVDIQTTSNGESAAMERCVARGLKRVRLDQPAAERWRFSYPFRFRDPNRDGR
jgi:hypothetical protein